MPQRSPAVRRSRSVGPSPSAAPLSGEYDRTGARLRRSDGLSLVVCVSHRGPKTGRDSARYVSVATAGGGRPRYAGNLYPGIPEGLDGDLDGPADDLDGCQFQDRADATRYAVRAMPSGRYTVGRAARRADAGAAGRR